MTTTGFQDHYPDDYAHCYGCGRLNEHGMRLKSVWDGPESVCRFTPRPHQTGGLRDIVYGGLIASLVDCHCAGTAAAAKLREEGFQPGERPMPRFVTASLKVDYIAPTPIGVEIEVRARVVEMKGRKAVIAATVSAGGTMTAKGEAVMVQLRETASATEER
ncbi:MAG TPA: PaaI family thioesterase [Spirochaetota bacterium]|nr:PaaI family thioesterase [Spirochaetota bacterium]HNT12265.1 PaaI family thioesterase [Spirochaetota bacterium]HNV47050.1 PaaI family thioesterase [Spirochaetota bacterium]HPU87923.1 PaaI family thioesterase [Spirochaetota bacterium]